MLNHILEQLQTPDKEFTPIPFWFLNDDLTDAELERQLTDFCKKGVHGVVLHPRIGIPETIPYLSDRFMHHIRFAVETAARLGMYVVLYDEAMYPSGSAHGLVVAQNPRFAAQAVILTDDTSEGKQIVSCKNGKYLMQVNSRGTIRGIHFGEDDGEENAPPAADLLSQDSVDTFIRLTHEKYYEVVGEYFGNTIIGFFTDEPSMLGRGERKGCFPWTWDFELEFTAAGGVLEDLEGLFTGADNPSTVLYRQLIAQKELHIYYESLYRFCEEHGIALMGHPHSGDDIESERYFHIPGQDIVLRWIAPEKDPLDGGESAQGKCSSDAARISGSRRNSNECFGACCRDNIPWYFTGGDMKWYMDYLGIRGVNLFIPHAFYYSVAGQRKEERPPDVGPNNIWWEHYEVISTYMKRLSYLMTDSVNEAKVCVMCANRNLRIEQVRPFFENQVEFNYLPYADFREEMVADGKLTVNGQSYSYILCDDRNLISGVPHIESVADLPYRDLYTEIPCPALRVSRLQKEGQRLIFLTNEGNTSIRTTASLDGETTLLAMDLWSGDFYRLPCSHKDQKTFFELDLPYRESLLLLLDETGTFPAQPPVSADRVSPVFTLLSQDEEQYVKTYHSLLSVETLPNKPVIFSVQAEEMTECFVNGTFVGFSLWNPHTFEISRYLKEGENEILLRVTGNAANRYGDHPIAYGLC